MRDRNLRTLLGLVVDAGLRGGVLPCEGPLRALPFVFPFVLTLGAPSATAETFASAGCGGNGFSSTGEAGGGGMFVPAVRDSRGPRTGSSKRPLVFPFAGISEI